MCSRRIGILLALLPAIGALITPLSLHSKDPAPEHQTYSGKVISLASAADLQGAALDKDAAPHWLALETKDGRLYPLFKDAGARMFFKDKKMLDRPVQLTGRMLKGSPILQVFSVRTVIENKLHEPYYWCDVCKIKRFEPNACDCCGDPLEFREEPISK